MLHEAPLIWMIVAGFGLAFIFGALANRLRMPPLVGYLVAGVLVGPFTPGFVADTQLASQLSEIGVILLMFGVGLHFSLKDLLSVQAVAVPGALLRIAGGTAMGMAMGVLLGWPIGGGLVFGLALSVASTVVLLKALQDRHLVESDRGRIAIGWVIVEDVAMVLALVLIPTFAGLMGGTAQEFHDPFVDLIERLSGWQLDIWAVLGVIGIKLLAFLGFMLVVGRRVIPWVLHMTAHTGSRELFRLAVLAIALGVAAGSAYVFGVSLALGAFFAGMILSESELSNRAAQESLPFRDAFAVLFFVSVGMLFDPRILITHPLEILSTLFIILIGKTALGFFLILALRRPIGAALTISVSLAQIGEFSFILAALGVSLGLFPVEAQSYILAGAIISIVLNPVLMFAAENLRPALEARFGGAPQIVLPQRVEPGMATPAPAPVVAEPEGDEEQHPTRLNGHVVLVGYGRVGTVIADGLHKQGTAFVIVEDAEIRVAAARALGIEVITGNAASGKALGLANTAGARCMLVGIPNAFEAGQVVEQARKVNPSLRIIARAHSDEEEVYLRDLGANEVIMGEREIGLGMLGWAEGEGATATAATQAQKGYDAIAAALSVAPATAVAGEPPAIVPVIPDLPVAPPVILPLEPAPAAAEAEPVEIAAPPVHSDPLPPPMPQEEPLPPVDLAPIAEDRSVPDAVDEETAALSGSGTLDELYPAAEAIVAAEIVYDPELTAVEPEDLAPSRASQPVEPLSDAMFEAMELALSNDPPVPEIETIEDAVPAEAPTPKAEPVAEPAPEPVPEPVAPPPRPRPAGPSSTPGEPYIVRASLGDEGR